ncbi:MAG: hypothetical protein FWH08_01350 [Oscillospiraceae bacterium]|nr:hypothetical protein [Oscillospiraceae bacterium]
MKREKSKYVFLWYLVLVLFGAWAGLLIGVATDDAVDDNGRLDISLMETPPFESLETYKKITEEESNASKGALIGGFVVTLVILHITVQ